MRTRRIAFVKSGLSKRGGLEKYTLRLAQKCAEAGHSVFLLTTDCEPAVSSGCTVVSFGQRKSLSLLHLLWFDRQVQNYLAHHPMDVVFGMDRNFCLQTHYRAGNGVHAAYLDRRKKRSSWLKSCSFSWNPLHRLLLQMERKTFESDDLKILFTNSSMVAREVESYYPAVDPAKICVVHNGVEWKEWQLPFVRGLQERRQIQQQLGLNPHKFQFLFIGNEYERKGLPLLLSALALLGSQEYELSVVGKERNLAHFQQLAQKFGVEQQVRFFGAVADAKPYYCAADCMVIPSLYDPFANVTVEALAFGVPVITSSANGGAEILHTADMGQVFDDLSNPEELLHLLQQAMHMPKTDESARRIRGHVEQLDFSNQIEKIVQRLY